MQSKNLKFAASLLLFFGAITSVFSQGTVSGVVTDATTKETLIGASILVQGSTKGTITNFDGEYSLTDVDPGTYTLVIQSMSYDKKVIPNVVVKNNQTTSLNIEMAEASFALENVVVVAKANRESENILLMEQKDAVVAKQAVGAKEMSRKGIGDAEGAVAQVSGVSKQEGVKNVFVRGLGDRNNYTTLNGFPIPSEDPEYKNISLDFFGSDIIKNIGVNKVFTATDYSDAAGAVIDIASKELVAESELSFDVSAGANGRTMGSDFVQPAGSDYFGFTNSTQPGDQYKSLYNYENSLDPTEVEVPMNYSYGFSGGKRFKVGKDSDPLSFFVVGNYSSSCSYTEEMSLDATADGTVYSDLDGYKSSKNINQLVLANVNYMPMKKHEISYTFLMIHDNSQNVGKYQGEGDDFVTSESYEGYMIRQQTNDNLLITNQLFGKFKLSEKLKMDAGIAYNRVKGTEPDRKINKLSGQDAPQYIPMKSEDAHQRSFSELIEDDYNGRIKFSYALPEKFKEDISTVHVGYNVRYVFDDFNASEYCYNSKFSDYQTLEDLTLDNWYNQANYDASKFYVDQDNSNGRRQSWYTVDKLINSGYASLDYQFNSKLILNAGLSVDVVDMNVEYDIKNGQKKGSNPLNNDKDFILPKVNMKYSFTDKHAMRVGLSKTYTLPQSKEISPYEYDGWKFKSIGNPDLKPADNYNADLKWDYYISSSELLTVTAFGKYIVDPIVRAYTNSAGGFLTYENISDHATIAGLELEVRKDIFNKTNSSLRKENKLSAGLNASYIYSNMTTEIDGTTKETQLEGASPWLMNVDLSYNYSLKDLSFTNSLVLNYFSDRIYTIGLYGYNDLIEKSVPTLNFVSNTDLNKHFSIKIKIKNLLDPEYQFVRKASSGETQVLSSYYKGMDFSLGLSYKL